ncbi:MAG: deoxyribodipyrimidine photo-lyase, partial [Chitinophagaceae bacterium]
GRTGLPIVDAAMLQLKETGWMHNRLRMVVAMFLTKNLQIDWRMGERYFMLQLIDGDFAANNGGWQWSASTGTDAAPYFRIFNPVSQSQRFDADGAFIRRYVPELGKLSAKLIHKPPPQEHYPLPIVDLSLSRKHTIELFGALKS